MTCFANYPHTTKTSFDIPKKLQMLLMLDEIQISQLMMSNLSECMITNESETHPPHDNFHSSLALPSSDNIFSILLCLNFIFFPSHQNFHFLQRVCNSSERGWTYHFSYSIRTFHFPPPSIYQFTTEKRVSYSFICSDCEQIRK